MKRNTSNWSNFGMLLHRAGLTASAGLSCYYYYYQARLIRNAVLCARHELIIVNSLYSDIGIRTVDTVPDSLLSLYFCCHRDGWRGFLPGMFYLQMLLYLAILFVRFSRRPYCFFAFSIFVHISGVIISNCEKVYFVKRSTKPSDDVHTDCRLQDTVLRQLRRRVSSHGHRQSQEVRDATNGSGHVRTSSDHPAIDLLPG